MSAQCNVCGSTAFEDFRTRLKERCASCGSLARHRLCIHFAEKYGMLDAVHTRRMLHLAPERVTSGIFEQRIGMGYVGADALPSGYPHLPCLRMFLPAGMDIFPSGYFDLIVHNHVLEHIPGRYQDALEALIRCVKTGGLMIFSVPGPWLGQLTVEGGEHLATDEERVAQFGQANHLKRFGRDMPQWLDARPDGELLDDTLTEDEAARLSILKRARFQIWRRTAAAADTTDIVPDAVVPGVLRGQVRNKHQQR